MYHGFKGTLSARWWGMIFGTASATYASLEEAALRLILYSVFEVKPDNGEITSSSYLVFLRYLLQKNRD